MSLITKYFNFGPLWIRHSVDQQQHFYDLICEEFQAGRIDEDKYMRMYWALKYEFWYVAENNNRGYYDRQGTFHIVEWINVRGTTKYFSYRYDGYLPPRSPFNRDVTPYIYGDENVSLTPPGRPFLEADICKDWRNIEPSEFYSNIPIKWNAMSHDIGPPPIAPSNAQPSRILAELGPWPLHIRPDPFGTRLDTPEPWGVFFQDNATPQMEGLEELHNNIFFYLAVILFAVSWILVSIVINYSKSKISNKYINHGTLVELIWTITPALILILIAFPSFKLLYLMDEVIDPSLVIYGEGHQWYWSYQYPDFTNNNEEYVEYDSYIIPESDLEKGKLRMLEVDNRVIIPELTHTRFVVAGADVIHSYACPSLGIKCDAYPGRLNQSSVYLNREGTYFGQCSEICGILHSSMPISIQSVKLGKFLFWLYDQIGN